MSGLTSARRTLVAVAGLLGASGVAAAAASAHLGGAFMNVAADMLLFHAAAVAAITAVAVAAASGRAFEASAALIAVGVVVFSGDLIMRDTAGHALFAYAAPTGGVLLIAGWLALAAAALLSR